MERHQDNVESVPVVGQAHTHPMKVRQNVPCAHPGFSQPDAGKTHCME